MRGRNCILGLLKELSSFFGTLPEPSAADLVDGTPLIPLHGTTTAGLVTFLHAINSITEILPLTLHGSSRGAAGIIGAAHIGKMYDVPIIYRILIEALTPARGAHLVELAIWVISNESSQIYDTIKSTLDIDITEIPEYVALAIQRHGPQYWMLLQDVHLRRALAPSRFQAKVDQLEHYDQCDKCEEEDTEGDPDDPVQVDKRLAGIKTMDEFEELANDDFGVSCKACLKAVKSNYQPAISWLTTYTAIHRKYGSSWLYHQCI